MRHLPTLATALLTTSIPAQQDGVALTAGVDGGIQVPFAATLVPPTGFTVEAWIRFADATMPTGLEYRPTIVRQHGPTAQESWLLRVASGSINNRIVEFAVRDGQGVVNVLAWPFLPGQLAGWTHLAATYDGRTMTLFKSGVLVAQRPLGAAHEVQNLGGVLRIGNGDPATAGRDTWHGAIDELRIWPMPRTAAEIAASSGQELSSLRCGIVTFNLNNGDFSDSSSGLLGTKFGTLGQIDGPPLVSLFPSGTNYGPSTTTCARTIDIAFGSLPTVGNGAYAVWCTKVPLGNTFGLFVIAAQQAPVQSPILGVALAFTPSSVLATTGFVPGAFGLGLQRQSLPIANDPRILGATVFAQFVFADAQCGPQGFVASDGLTISVQSG